MQKDRMSEPPGYFYIIVQIACTYVATADISTDGILELCRRSSETSSRC